ncbi:response regulator [Humisphaera borealis]|uniref:Response regulator transcription factor n=1 Tax=Humisphaera borealis TaxID=2807512 RepID=A0A7M2WVT4_9BACT|nr:response regulator transcription factor [Humisphaera borealis]QOV88961.1 response regulator transcription factor [Humisphaera borealis]
MPAKKPSAASARTARSKATAAAPTVATAETNGKAEKSSSSKRRIFIVDDHPIVRQGLVQLINKEPDMEVVGEGEDVYESIRAIRTASPDLCLVDVSLKSGDGLELMKEIKSSNPEQAVLILSMHDEKLYAERALRAGARGYIMKQEPPQVLVNAIRNVLAGEIYVSPNMGATLLHRMVGSKTASNLTPMDRLTDRELEVFRMIGAGMRVRDIAEKLFLSAKTIEAHREHIKEKLGLKTSAELLRFAIRNTPDSN